MSQFQFNYLGLSILIVYIIVIIGLILANKRDKNYLIILVAIFICSYHLFRCIVPYEHPDTAFHMARIKSMAIDLQNGYLIPRIYSFMLNYYGNACGVCYPSLFLYIPAILCQKIDISNYSDFYAVVNSFRIILTIFTAEITYFSLRKLYKNNIIGIIGTIIALFMTYRFDNLKIIGGQTFIYISLPLYIMSIYYLCETKKWYYYVIATTIVLGTSMPGIFLCALYTIIFFIFYLIIKRSSFFTKERMLNFLYAGIFLILINIHWFVPFFTYITQKGFILAIKNYGSEVTAIGTANLSGMINNFISYIKNKWLYYIFVLCIFVMFIKIFLIVKQKFEEKKLKIKVADKNEIETKSETKTNNQIEINNNKINNKSNNENKSSKKIQLEEGILKQDKINFKISLVLFFMFIVSMNFFYNKPLFDALNKITIWKEIYKNLQFVGRHEAFFINFIIMFIPYYIYKLLTFKNIIKDKFIPIIMFVVVLSLNFNYIKNSMFSYEKAQNMTNVEPAMVFDDYVYENAFRDIRNLGDDWARVNKYYEKITTGSCYSKNENVYISDLKKNCLTVEFSYSIASTDKPPVVICPINYYIGYVAKDDKGNKLKTFIDDDTGLLSVELKVPEGKVTAKFKDLWYWTLFDILSLLSFIYFLLYVYVLPKWKVVVNEDKSKKSNGNVYKNKKK